MHKELKKFLCKREKGDRVGAEDKTMVKRRDCFIFF